MPISYKGVRELAVAFGSVPLELRRELRPKIRAAAELIQRQAQQNASWSSEIPGRITTGVRFSRYGGAYVKVKAVDGHERAYEGWDGNATFRHPVFGNRANWVEQATRPYLRPAADDKRDEAVALVAEAVRSATAHLKV